MKNFNEYRFTELKKWFSFGGRASRKDYILTYFVYVIAVVIISVIFYILTGQEIENFQYSSDSNMVPGIIIVAIMLLFCYLNLSIVARRFHDMDYSSWALIFMFIPIVNIVFTIILLFKKGTYGMNRYGKDPLDKNNSIDFFDTDD